MKLFLIRHGQSKGNVKPGFMSGRTDLEGLTHKGKIQMIRTAYELRNENINKIMVSPVVRAQESSQILHRHFPKASIKTEGWLSELHHGVFEGFYWWEVIHKIPPEWRKQREEYATAYPGGGESMQMMFERVSNGLNNLISQLEPDDKVLLISHQAPITAMRYFMKHGGPEKLTTEKKQKAFYQYLHDVKLPNGGCAHAAYKGKSLKSLVEIKEFDPVSVRKGNIEFYAKGVFDVDTVEAEKKNTVSKHAVYHIKNGGSHLLKVLHAENTKSVRRHVEAYQYLSSQGSLVPKVILHDNTYGFYKDDVLIQDYVTGVEQDICILEHPKKAGKVLKSIYAELHKIHQIPTQEVQKFWLPPGEKQFRSWKPFMLSNINLTLHMGQDGIWEKEAEKYIISVLSFLKDYIRNGNYEVVPIHGDMSSGNIIISHKKEDCTLLRFIDFERTRMGDRLWDVAYYWGWLERENAHVAHIWEKIIEKEFSKKDKKVLSAFRILFHAWTVRDMLEYQDDPIRQQRGEQSREILHRAKQ